VIDLKRIENRLVELLSIASPCGLTDDVIHYLGGQLEEIGIPFDVTRRGTIRAAISGNTSDSPGGAARAICNHVDSIGAMVRFVKPDGRLLVAPIGYWSSRFAEGARVSLFTVENVYRGTLLPMANWGVSRDHGVDQVPIDWDHIELRLDEPVFSAKDVGDLGVEVGDFVALDSRPEVFENGYIVGRNLDNKAGAAAVLEAIQHVVTEGLDRPRDVYLLFTVTETIGAGSGSAILPDISELVTVDFASIPPEEKSPFKRVTIATGDAAGPYDYHLTAHLGRLAESARIPFQRKVLEASHNDAASALAAGHDVRTAVITYAGDASHSVERTHVESLANVARLLVEYVTSPPAFKRDPSLTTVADFPQQIDVDKIPEPQEPPHAADVIRKHRR